VGDLEFRLRRGSGLLGIMWLLWPSVAVPVISVEVLMANPNGQAASVVIGVGVFAIYVPLLAVDALAVWKLNYTRCGESGICTRRLAWTRRCPWPQVSDITVERVALSTRNPYARGKIRAVRVHTTSGRSFLLGAPVDGGFKPDPDFDASVAKIQAYWRTWRAHHPGHLWLYSWPANG